MSNVHYLTRPVIGFYADKPQAGKSTAAFITQDILAARHIKSQIVTFAAPLKHATAAFLEALGLSDAEATRYLFEEKDTVIPQLGRTGRDFLIKLGTDLGRNFVHPLCWVNSWEERAKNALKSRWAVVCDDVRTPDEATAIKALGGVIIEVRRPGQDRGPRALDAGTEGRLSGCTNHVVENDGNLTQLTERLTETLRNAGVIQA